MLLGNSSPWVPHMDVCLKAGSSTALSSQSFQRILVSWLVSCVMISLLGKAQTCLLYCIIKIGNASVEKCKEAFITFCILEKDKLLSAQDYKQHILYTRVIGLTSQGFRIGHKNLTKKETGTNECQCSGYCHFYNYDPEVCLLLASRKLGKVLLLDCK